MYIKSPLNYIGGKYKLLDDLFTVFPKEINTFVDLFAGGFNVGVNVNANKIICNDHINYLIEMYKYFQKTDTNLLIKSIREKISQYELSLENAEGYNKFRAFYNKTGNILDLFILTCFAFNHQIRFNSKHEFNTPFGRDRSTFNSSIEQNLRAFCYSLQNKNIEFVSQDFTTINLDKLDSNDFVYCDPPYLISTGSYNDGKRGFKDWTEEEEIQLLNKLDALNKQKVKFALSNVFYHKGAQNDLLIDWSKKYCVLYLDKTYTNCNYHLKNKETKTVEVLVLNYVPKKDTKCHQENLF